VATEPTKLAPVTKPPPFVKKRGELVGDSGGGGWGRKVREVRVVGHHFRWGDGPFSVFVG